MADGCKFALFAFCVLGLTVLQMAIYQKAMYLEASTTLSSLRYEVSNKIIRCYPKKSSLSDASSTSQPSARLQS